MEERTISDGDVINACEILRLSYLRLDSEVMPLNERLNKARYYGGLKIKLLTLIKMAEMKKEGK